MPTNALHAKGYVSIGCEPCTRAVLPNQHEREGRWWWEVRRAKSSHALNALQGCIIPFSANAADEAGMLPAARSMCVSVKS